MILRTAAMATGLLLGVLASQIPEYAQQYRQRLGGAIDEINRMLADFDADAARAAMSRNEGVERLSRNPDVFVAQRGQRVREEEARAQRLERQLAAMREGGPVRRVAVLARDFDSRIAQRAWESYEPAVPTTVEGALAAVIGFFLGWSALRTAGWAARRRRAQRRGALA
ncbi:MAG TPA: DUF2937 family protein [Beijerinckiaceae bacterium]